MDIAVGDCVRLPTGPKGVVSQIAGARALIEVDAPDGMRCFVKEFLSNLTKIDPPDSSSNQSALPT